MTILPLRQRLVRGVQAQLLSHVARVVSQIVSVSVLIAAWGLHQYGDWLILAAVPTYLAFSDIGFTGAATNEMTMAAGAHRYEHARTVFQAVSTALLIVLVLLAITLPVIALLVPISELLNLSSLSNATAGWAFVALGFEALFTVYAGLLYGALASGGYYGEGAMLTALTMLGEFGALAAAALAGGNPAEGAAAMLAAQIAGTVLLYVRLRRRVPWLWAGRPAGMRAVLRPLLTPAIASGAIPGALALNIQGMVLVIGIAVSPAAAAIFSTLRTMSRAVVQVVSSVNAVVTPEISRAFAGGDVSLLRTFHRRGCQWAVWMALGMVIVLVLASGPVLHIWTSGKVGRSGLVLYLLLATAVVGSTWYTSLAVLFATNRHQRAAAHYTAVSLLSLPLAYLLLRLWGLDGAAVTILLLDAFMVVPVVHKSLRFTDDDLGAWLRAVAFPPLVRGTLGRVRTKLRTV